MLGDELDVATALALHPTIPPGFTRAVTTEDDIVRCTLTPATPALLDPAQGGWIGALLRGDTRGVEGMVMPVDRRARVEALETTGDAVTITVRRNAADNDAGEPDAVAFMRIGMLASWKFSL